MKILGIHHISIATEDINRHAAIFESLFDIGSGPTEENDKSGVLLSFLDFGNVKVELISPTDENSAISKFLHKKGTGIHHICVLVEDIYEALDELKKKNVKLIDQEPRIGAGGSRIAFIHPEAAGGILIELEEKH